MEVNNKQNDGQTVSAEFITLYAVIVTVCCRPTIGKLVRHGSDGLSSPQQCRISSLCQ